MTKLCLICKVTDAKYKCPTCTIFYCSVTCCKQHKLENCAIGKKPESHESDGQAAVATGTTLYPTDDTVELNRLNSLANNTELKNILSNKHLRNLLASVNDAENPEAIMARAMQEPIFVEFANACLASIESNCS